jgi:hypothetical protein
MDGEQHGRAFRGTDIVGHIRIENQHFTRLERMIRTIRFDSQRSLENVDAHQPTRAMLIEVPTGLEGEEDLGDGPAVEHRDLAMTVSGWVIFAPQLGESARKRQGVGAACESLRRGRP